MSPFLSFKFDLSKLIQAILVSSCLVLYLFFYTPSDIFFKNATEFDYIYNEILLYILLISVSAIGILTLILVLLPKSLFKVVLSLMVVLTILFWLQGTVFYKDYGFLDGGEINWNKWAAWGYFESGFWMISVILAITYATYIKKLVNKICIVLLMIIISTFVIKYIEYYQVDEREMIFNESIKFDFSSEKNVILILIDEVQSDVFYEIISENHDFKEQFSGFVFYPDTVAGHPFTKTSVPNILTGKYYDNSIPLPEYIEDSYLGYSIPKILKERNYQVDIIPTFYDDTILKSDEVASNLIRQGQITNIEEGLYNSFYLIDIALFRNAPHLLKRYVINDYLWFISRYFPNEKLSHLNWWSGDDNFYGELSDINYSIKGPVFKFFHLKGCHAPYNRDSAGKHVRSKNSRQSYKDFLVFNLKRLVSFLEQLKIKGIYDKSLIYILSDHGAGRYEELKVNTELIEKHSSTSKVSISHRIKARAVTLLMIKDFFSVGSMKISNMPVSLSEIPQMMFKDLNIKLDESDSDSNTNETVSDNTRKYLYYNYPYVEPLYEFVIDGHGWLNSSWSGPNKVYNKDGVYKKVFSVQFEQNKSNDYKTYTTGLTENYKFESSGNRDHFISINKENHDSKYFLSFILDKNREIDNLGIYIYVDNRKLKTIQLKRNYHITEFPIFGINIPKGFSRKNSVEIRITYKSKVSLINNNPFKSIFLFKRLSVKRFELHVRCCSKKK